MTKSLLQLIAILVTLAFTIAASADGDVEAWQTREAKVDSRIKVESVQLNGIGYEVVHLPTGETVEIPLELTSPEIIQSGLTPGELEMAREDARETMEMTLQAVMSDDFSGSIAVGEDGKALSLQPVNLTEKKTNIFKRLFSYNYELYKPMPQGLKASQKLKRFLKMTWQFVLVETIHAGINYYKDFKTAHSRFTEFGLVLDFKLEPQVFIGKFNPGKKIKALSRNYALFFEISYSRTARRLMVRTRYRREQGAGGLGLPGIKAELKVFESDGARSAYKGKSWYPVSPPLVSFVLDSSEHYFAQGLTIGLNTGDLVPGSTLTNTFTQFVQTDNTLKVSNAPRAAGDAFVSLANRTFPPRRAANAPHMMCRQLFN